MEKKHKVKISMFFRGRENAHVDVGMRVMNRFLETIAEKSKVESPPRKLGKNLITIVVPK